VGDYYIQARQTIFEIILRLQRSWLVERASLDLNDGLTSPPGFANTVKAMIQSELCLVTSLSNLTLVSERRAARYSLNYRLFQLQAFSPAVMQDDRGE
jgi:hypothetical protein